FSPLTPHLSHLHDHLPRLRVCGEVSRRRRKFFRAPAVDAWAAASEAGCDLVGVTAGHKRCGGGRSENQEFPEPIARARIIRPILFALSQTCIRRARFGWDSLHGNFKTSTRRSTAWTECSAQSRVFN